MEMPKDTKDLSNGYCQYAYKHMDCIPVKSGHAKL